MKDYTLVITNGCFDMLHVGHVDFLERCRELGNHLLVGVDSNANVMRLKGRMINDQADRLRMVKSLKVVDSTEIFDGSAKEFISKHMKHGATIYVKGDDRDRKTMDQEDRKALDSWRVPIIFLPRIEGKSTTELIAKIIKEGVDLSGG